MVPGTAGFLLQHHGQGMHHDSSRHSSAGAPDHSSTHSVPHAAAHATSDTTSDTTTHASAHSATTTSRSSACWSSGPIQLRRGCRKYLGSCQESVVLQSPPPRMPTHRTSTSTVSTSTVATSAVATLAASDANNATRPSGPIQLRGRIRELASRLECPEKGVVLQGSWKGLPRSTGRWVCSCGNHLCTIRLQCRICKLDGWVVCGQERLVLPQRWKGLSSGSRRLCLSLISEQT